LFLGIGVGLMWYLYDSNKDGKNFKEIAFKQEVNIYGKTILTWNDTTKLNNEFYTIERSEDGKYFEYIDTIKLQGQQLNYTHFDEKASKVDAKQLHYKIKGWSAIDLWKEIGNMNMKWYILAFILSIVSNYSRAVRWQTIIEPMGYKPNIVNTFLSINIMYLSNSLIPRSGELSRCSILYRYDKIPITKLFGTVLVERIVDMLCFGLMLGILFVSQFGLVREYLLRPDVKESLEAKANLWPILIAVAVIGLIALIVIIKLRERILQTSIGKKIGKILFDLWEGIKSTKNIERKWAFIFHTVLIWTMYFGVLYVSFFSYESTAELGFTVAFAALIMGSLGMIIPTAGGIGTWNLMVTLTLVLYGVSEPNAFIYSFIALFMMTITSVIAGSLSFMYLPIYNRKSKLQQTEKQ